MRRGKAKDDNVDGAPWVYHVDPESITKADQWVQSGHPTRCELRLDLLHDAAEVLYSTTQTRLLVHLMKEHGAGFDAVLKAGFVPGIGEERTLGLADLLFSRQDELLEALMRHWVDIEADPNGPRTVALLCRHLNEANFERLWSLAWNGATAPKAPRLAGTLLWTAAYSDARSRYAVEVCIQRLEEAFDIAPRDLVAALVRAMPLLAVRDSGLEKLLASREELAARLIIEEARLAKEPPPVVPAATRLLVDKMPSPQHRIIKRDEPAAVGVGLCLMADREYATRTIVRWVNEEHYHLPDELTWMISQTQQADLFVALAKDATSQPRIQQDLLARYHHGLIAQSGCVLEWLERNTSRKEGVRYRASLTNLYLSDPPKETESAVIDRLVKHAHALFEVHSSVAKDFVRREARLSNHPKQARHLAVALAQELVHPHKPVDSKAILQTIKNLPATYEALGGQALDRALERGEMIPNGYNYAVNLAEERTHLAARRASGTIHEANAEFWENHLQKVEFFRAAWEIRFGRLLEHKVQLPKAKLRKDANVWKEMRVLTLLLRHFRSVDYQPQNVEGIHPKRPEFLCHSEDGDLVIEMTSRHDGPEDIFDKAHKSAGDETRTTLINKLNDQFHGGKTDLKVAAVILVEERHDLDDFDMLNSLYGPLSVSFSTNTATGAIMSEGWTRKREYTVGNDDRTPFFTIPESAVISAVGGISPFDFSTEVLRGELHRPLLRPKKPINAQLWVRLRTALFGRRPKNCVESMARIPSITHQEVEALVDAGVDDLDFFVGGAIERPQNCSVSLTRFDELRRAAARYAALSATDQVRFLAAAEAIELSVLTDNGIHTLHQLLHQPDIPEGFEADVWKSLQAEAAAFLSATGRPFSPSRTRG